MKDEKSLVEYKETKGLFQWLKSKFAQLRDRFKMPRNEEQDSQEIFEDELDEIKGGYPLKNETLEHNEKKTWELTEQQKEVVEKGYEEIQRDKDELSQEELDKITAGVPIIDDNENER